MPIGFSPDDYIETPLDCVDKDKPDRAKFRIRFITSRELKQLERKREAAWAAITAAKYADADKLLNEAIRIGIIGWTGLPVEYALAAEGADDVLDEFTQRTKFAIVDEYPWRLLLSNIEKKASSSPSPEDTAVSAKDAPAGNAGTAPA